MRGLAATGDLLEFGLDSAAARGLPPSVFQRLARYTLEANPRRGLTGELRLGDGRFSLDLEGRADLLLPLAARILADPRHGAIEVRAFGRIAARRFPGWRVAGFGLDEAEAGTDALRFAPPFAGRAAPRRTLSI